jgi:hypothetical protein
MLSQIFRILTVLLSFQYVFSLNTEDICYSSTAFSCNGKYSYQCNKYLCSLNKQICEKFFPIRGSHSFRLLFLIERIKTQMKACDFCFKNNEKQLNCSKKRSKTGFRKAFWT